MSIASGNHKYNLPPNVRGKQRGTLKLTVLDIIPKSPTTSISSGTTTSSYIGSNYSRGRNPICSIGSGGVSVRLIWWGQSHENSAVLNYSPVQKPCKESAGNHCVDYSIQTTANLFQNYLANCEPVEIKLTSNTSNLQIGTAFLKIPKALVENCTKVDAEHIETVKIFSPRNAALGEIRLKFKMLFHPRPENAQHKDSLVEMKLSAPGKENELHIPHLDSSRSCKSIKSDFNTYISQIRQKTNRPATATSTTASLSYRALDYLNGRDMSEADKNKALEEIQSTSPLESLVTELTNRLKMPARDIFERIDSLRLALLTITILPAGLRELECSQLDERTFTVESHISPNLLSDFRAKYDHDVMRFYSGHVDGKERRIDFNRDAIRSIKISEYVDNSYIRFTIWSRPFGSKYSRCFGTAKLQFGSMLEAGELEQTKKLTIKSCTDKTCVGYLVAKVTLGTKGVHFGEDFLTIIENEKQHESPPTTTRSRTCKIHRNQTPIFEIIDTSCRKCNNNDTKKKPNSPKSSHCNATNRSTCSRQTASNHTELDLGNHHVSSTESNKDKDSRQTIEIDKSINRHDQHFLQGLLYVGSIRHFRDLPNGGYFLVCRAFWKEDATSTEFCQDNSFNFLEIFPVVNNDTFLERTRNNHLDLELWQKFTDTAEQMVGIVKLPLHQFYIAFRDNALTSHLSQAKLPVISIDGWVTVTSPLSAESCGQLQVLLAIGTEEQLEYLKASRGLCLNRVYDASLSNSLENRLPVPQNVPGQKACERSTSSCDAESQTNFPENNQDNAETSVRRERLSDLLGNFIDSLAQKLPPNSAQTTDASAATTNTMENSINQPAQGSQLKKTSDLLVALHKALIAPPPDVDSVTNANLFKLPSSTLGTNVLRRRFVKILLDVENALHLPRNPKKIGNKKMLKRNNNASKCKQSRLPADEEPSAYVTFQAEEGSGAMIKSHEGMVYSTNVVEKCCNPVWNRRFEIYVPADLMKNDEKRFIVKVWRKRVTDLAQCRVLPTPLEDAIIGFAAVDLNVLLAGMPCIAGWFNIVDFNGRINGQIKVNVRPLEDVLKFKDPARLLGKHPVVEPANISANVIKSAPTVTGVDMNNSILSRAIKRKFTELEEITERLRARLLDVTGTPECPATINSEEMLDADQIDEQLDEFERDLNTACDEDHPEATLENFGWLGVAGGLSNGSGNEDSDMSLSTNDSQERIKMISECLRRTDLNFVGDNVRLGHSTKERNPPEGETSSSCEKKHVD